MPGENLIMYRPAYFGLKLAEEKLIPYPYRTSEIYSSRSSGASSRGREAKDEHLLRRSHAFRQEVYGPFFVRLSKTL
jgi:hypothetical protein